MTGDEVTRRLRHLYYVEYYRADPDKFRRATAAYMARNLQDPRIRAMGRELRKGRKELGLSQKKMGATLGTRQGVVSAWENGRIPANINRIGKVYPELAEEIRRARSEVRTD